MANKAVGEGKDNLAVVTDGVPMAVKDGGTDPSCQDSTTLITTAIAESNGKVHQEQREAWSNGR